MDLSWSEIFEALWYDCAICGSKTRLLFGRRESSLESTMDLSWSEDDGEVEYILESRIMEIFAVSFLRYGASFWPGRRLDEDSRSNGVLSQAS